MTDMERLAIAQGVFNAVGEMVSTKDPNNLRGRVNDKIIKAYLSTGARSFDLRLNGHKVGSFSVTVAKAKRETKLKVIDRDAFEAWALSEGFAHEETVTRVVMDEDAVLSDALLNGEVPDGCEPVTKDEPEHVSGTSIRGCKPEDVASALGTQLPQAVAGFLTGGE